MGRKKSKELILEQAKGLFWKYGIKKVTVEEISQAAGVSKMTFYRNFQNKLEVASVVLNRFCEEGKEEYRRIMQREIPFWERMSEILRLKKAQAEEMSMEFIADIQGFEFENLQAELMAHSQSMIAEIRADIAAGQKEGWVRQDLNLDFLMLMLNGMQQMAQNPQLQQLFSSPAEMHTQMTKLLFYGMAPERE